MAESSAKRRMVRALAMSKRKVSPSAKQRGNCIVTPTEPLSAAQQKLLHRLDATAIHDGQWRIPFGARTLQELTRLLASFRLPAPTYGTRRNPGIVGRELVPKGSGDGANLSAKRRSAQRQRVKEAQQYTLPLSLAGLSLADLAAIKSTEWDFFSSEIPHDDWLKACEVRGMRDQTACNRWRELCVQFPLFPRAYAFIVQQVDSAQQAEPIGPFRSEDEWIACKMHLVGHWGRMLDAIRRMADSAPALPTYAGKAKKPGCTGSDARPDRIDNRKPVSLVIGEGATSDWPRR